MADESKKFSIRIDTEGNPSGAKSISGALADVSKETAKAKEGLEGVSETLKDADEGLEAGQRTARSLAGVLSGDLTNATETLSLGFKGVLGALKANPIGFILGVVTEAISLYKSAVGALEEGAGKADEALDAAGKAAEEFRQAAEKNGKLSEEDMGKVKTAVGGITTELGSAAEAADRLKTSLQTVINTNKELASSKVRLQVANKEISDEEGARRLAAIEGTAAQETLAGEAQAEGAKIAAAQAAIDKAESEEASLAERLKNAETRAAQLQKATEQSLKGLQADESGAFEQPPTELAKLNRTGAGDAAQVKAAEAAAAAYAKGNPADRDQAELIAGNLSALSRAQNEAAALKTQLAEAKALAAGVREAGEKQISESTATLALIPPRAEIATNNEALAKIAADKAEKERVAAAALAAYEAGQGQAAKTKAQTDAEELKGLQNKVTLMEQAAADAEKDTPAYRAALQNLGAARSKLIQATARMAEEGGTATPATREASRLELEGVATGTDRAVTESKDRADAKQKKDAADMEKMWQEGLEALDLEIARDKQGKRSPWTGRKMIDGRAPQANPPRGLNSGGSPLSDEDWREQFTPGGARRPGMESDDDWNDRFKPKMDFRSGRGGSADAGDGGAGAGQLDNAAGKMQTAGADATAAAAKIAAVGGQFQSLAGAVETFASTVTGGMSGLQAQISAHTSQINALARRSA